MIVENEVRVENGINLLLKLLVTVMAILQPTSFSFSFSFFLSQAFQKILLQPKQKNWVGIFKVFKIITKSHKVFTGLKVLTDDSRFLVIRLNIWNVDEGFRPRTA